MDAYPVVMPLDDPRCRTPGLVGASVAIMAAAGAAAGGAGVAAGAAAGAGGAAAATGAAGAAAAGAAGAAATVAVPPAVVATAVVPAWAAYLRSGRGPEVLLAGAAHAVPMPVSLRGWLVGGGAGGRRDRGIGPPLRNLDAAAAAEAVIELVALAGHVDGDALLAIRLQAYLAVDASVIVLAGPAAEILLVRACWGHPEDLGAGVHYDRLWLGTADLSVRRSEVVDKPTATVAADGGTHTVGVAPQWRSSPVIPDAALASSIAATALRLASRLGHAVELELGIAPSRLHLIDADPFDADPFRADPFRDDVTSPHF